MQIASGRGNINTARIIVHERGVDGEKKPSRVLTEAHAIFIVPLHLGNLEHPQNLFPAFCPFLAV